MDESLNKTLNTNLFSRASIFPSVSIKKTGARLCLSLLSRASLVVRLKKARFISRGDKRRLFFLRGFGPLLWLRERERENNRILLDF